MNRSDEGERQCFQYDDDEFSPPSLIHSLDHFSTSVEKWKWTRYQSADLMDIGRRPGYITLMSKDFLRIMRMVS